MHAFAAYLMLGIGGGLPADTTAAIGSKVANLGFKDIRYAARSLDDLPGRKAYVLVFTGSGCPLAARYMPTLKKLDAEYRERGVQFLAVNSGRQDAIVEMAAQATKFDVPFHFVKDMDGAVAKAVGATRTPQVVVLDSERRIRYRGRIDDQFRVSGGRPDATRADLKIALDEILAGKSVSVAETPVDGCVISLDDVKANDKLTFAEHVAPLMQKHCQSCHRANSEAPFALLSYDDVKKHAGTIAETITEQRMPPWHGDPEQTELCNRPTMPGPERETVLAWIKAGMPRGDAAKDPPAKQFPTEKWRIGQPDLVISAAQLHELPASGDVDYKYAILPHYFMQDTWVQGVEILPDNPRVVHHCNMAYTQLGGKYNAANFVTGRVPGGVPMTLPEGEAFLFPKGSIIGLQIHYLTTGKPEKCRVSVGLRYARGTVDRRLRLTQFATNRFAIPSEATHYPVKVTHTMPTDGFVEGLFAHMHLRGKDMSFVAHYPDGRSETLVAIPNYSYDWQAAYRYTPGTKRIPKGTKIDCIAHYDNSSFNPFNPDPKRVVRYGDQVRDEMMFGFFFYTDANEKLNLQVDPKTGYAMKPATHASARKAP